MDLETALDHRTRISVYAAMHELEKHGNDSYVKNDTLYGSTEPGVFEQICIVYKGEVKTRPLMRWLGY